MSTYIINEETGCWEWQGFINESGYGLAYIDGRQVSAHRAMYQLHVGGIPADHQVHHVCRNRSCVNPAHLVPLDRAAHGETWRKPAVTKLGELIEQRGVSIRALAVDVGIPERTVYRHVKGQVIPNLTQAAAYARVLDVTLDDLVEAAA